MFSNAGASIAVAAIISAFLGASAVAAPTQAEISREISLTTSAATAVIAGLQDKINGAKLTGAEAESSTLRAAFKEQFKKMGGTDFDTAPEPVLGQIRKDFAEAFDLVIDKFRPDMIKGGQDAFVQAFFRAQLLDQFNKKAQGKYQAIATMRTSELINRDSAPEKVMTDKAALQFVNVLLERGEAVPQSKQIGDKLVGYWPMKIGEPCAVCHQRNGLDQKVGAFGGATVVIVEAQR